MENEELRNLVMRIAKKHGFEQASAKFCPFRDFKIRWTRNHVWVDFEISDYLEDTPEDIMEELMETVIGRMLGEKRNYPKSVKTWLQSDEFCNEHQIIYLRRVVGLSDSDKGEAKDLMESYGRLVSEGLAEDDPNCLIRWIHGRSNQSSALMKIVMISDRLDSEDVDDDVVDYALFKELENIRCRDLGNPEKARADVKKALSEYPKAEELEAILGRVLRG